MSIILGLNKIQKELSRSAQIQQELFKLSRVQIHTISDNYLKKVSSVDLLNAPIYYDLYNYNGIITAIGTTSPTPSSAYKATLISGSTYSYEFIYPVYGFPVPIEETPESHTDNATPWTYKTTIAVYKNIINFPVMPAWALDGSRLICYVYTEDGGVVNDLAFVLLEGGTNIQTISVDFNYFYRWIECERGYNFEFYCIYPIATGRNLNLFAKLYLYNPKHYYATNSTKI